MKPRVILSVDSFLENLSVGGKFWYMTSYGVKPTGIVGPCTVLALKQDSRNEWYVEFMNEIDGFLYGDGTPLFYISKFVDNTHGVFLNAEDAEMYWKRRIDALIEIAAFETEPKEEDSGNWWHGNPS